MKNITEKDFLDCHPSFSSMSRRNWSLSKAKSQRFSAVRSSCICTNVLRYCFVVLFLLFYIENNTSGHLCRYMKTLPSDNHRNSSSQPFAKILQKKDCPTLSTVKNIFYHTGLLRISLSDWLITRAK
jgi:hypothetical protein